MLFEYDRQRRSEVIMVAATSDILDPLNMNCLFNIYECLYDIPIRIIRALALIFAPIVSA